MIFEVSIDHARALQVSARPDGERTVFRVEGSADDVAHLGKLLQGAAGALAKEFLVPGGTFQPTRLSWEPADHGGEE